MLIKPLLGIQIFSQTFIVEIIFRLKNSLILTDLLILPSLKIEFTFLMVATKFDVPKEKSFMKLKQVKETAYFSGKWMHSTAAIISILLKSRKERESSVLESVSQLSNSSDASLKEGLTLPCKTA